MSSPRAGLGCGIQAGTMQGRSAARVGPMPCHRDTPPLSSVGRQDGQRAGWSHGSFGGSRARGQPLQCSCLCYTTFPNPEPLGGGCILAGCRRRRSIKLVLSDGHLTPDPWPPPHPRCTLDFNFICWSEKKKSNGERPPLANIPRGS